MFCPNPRETSRPVMAVALQITVKYEYKCRIEKKNHMSSFPSTGNTSAHR